MLSLKVESKLQLFVNLQIHLQWAQLNVITQEEIKTDHNKQKMITLADLPLPLNGTCPSYNIIHDHTNMLKFD
jgi:hypothetical protein